MTKPVRFTKSELESAARLCRDHGVVVKMTRGGDLLVFPDTHRPGPVDISENDDLDAELAAFEAKHGHG